MSMPRVRADFNTSSLDNAYTREDLRRLGLELRPGLWCVFYDFDAEGDEKGFLHVAAEVSWDEKLNKLRWDKGDADFRFTPGTDLSALDPYYPE